MHRLPRFPDSDSGRCPPEGVWEISGWNKKNLVLVLITMFFAKEPGRARGDRVRSTGIDLAKQLVYKKKHVTDAKMNFKTYWKKEDALQHSSQISPDQSGAPNFWLEPEDAQVHLPSLPFFAIGGHFFGTFWDSWWDRPWSPSRHHLQERGSGKCGTWRSAPTLLQLLQIPKKKLEANFGQFGNHRWPGLLQNIGVWAACLASTRQKYQLPTKNREVPYIVIVYRKIWSYRR